MKKPKKIKFVQQEETCGCTVACAAMVMGRTYSDVRRDFTHDFENEGYSFDSIIEYLGEQGFAAVYKETRNYQQVSFARDEMLRPFAPVHILHLKATFDAPNSHVVVMDAAGKILCPDSNTDEQIRDWYAVLGVVGLYEE